MELYLRKRKVYFCTFLKTAGPIVAVILFILLAEPVFAIDYKIDERTKFETREYSRDSVALVISHDFSVPLSLKISFRGENLIVDSSELVRVIPAHASQYVVARFKKKVKRKPFSCIYDWKLVIGDVSQTPDIYYPYIQPILKGRTYRISQGPGGKFSHQHSFAYDFAIPRGTPITAAREGVVAATKYDSSIGGADRKFVNDANFVSILHADGTLANYAHLDTDGVLVKEGDTVKRGQVLGYSGNTGFSTGPHLHFEIVRRDASLAKEFVEFTWDGEKHSFLPSLHEDSVFSYLNKTRPAGKVVSKDENKSFGFAAIWRRLVGALLEF